MNFRDAFPSFPIERLMKNVQTKVVWERIGKYDCPITINELELESSYVVSPYSALVLYSRQEMVKLPSYFKVLELILGPVALLLASIRINKMVAINNWLLSTNIYPEIEAEEFLKIGNKYRDQFKDHFIIFRSLNYRTNKALIEKLLKNGFTLIPSRQVYIFDFKAGNIMERSNNRHDQRLLKKNTFTFRGGDTFSDDDFKRAEELYNLLYIEKYSTYNPQFTAEYLKLCHETRCMMFFGLYSTEGVMEGVLGFFYTDKIITAPVVGYNTKMDRSFGLYRILMARTLKHAFENNLLLNLSSGASGFKILRGGKAYTEYSAVSIKGLSFGRRMGFRVIQAILFGLVVPLLKIFKL